MAETDIKQQEQSSTRNKGNRAIIVKMERGRQAGKQTDTHKQSNINDTTNATTKQNEEQNSLK